MTRTQLSFRLLTQASMKHSDHANRAMTEVVPALVSHLRSADAEGHWHFRREGGTLDAEVEVCFHATPSVIDELEHQLRLQIRQHDWPMHLPGPRHSSAAPGSSGAASQAPSVADRLSACSSDFALNVLANGGLAAAERLCAAAANLRFVTEIMPGAAKPAERAAFLFLGWQQWSRELSPAKRLALGGQACEVAPAILSQAAETIADSRWNGLWQDYFAAVESILASGQSPGLPVRYVLFEHAHLTHNRLGIPAATEALAARALREALADSEKEEKWR